MRILVVGHTGTIGKAVAELLAKNGHEVVGASRHGELRVDLADPASVRALLAQAGPLDAVVSAAGEAAFGELSKLSDADFEKGLRSKLMGQVNLARAAMGHLRDGGSITLTSGVLATKPMPGSASISLVNAGLEGFVRAAALELPRGLRINVVSPPWVTETLEKLGMDTAHGMPASDVARAYVAAVEGKANGTVITP